MSLPIWVPDTEIVRAGPDNTYRWATVTDTAPLRLRLDGDTEGLPVTPDSLINPASLVAGDRVWVQIFGRRLVVLGKGSGVNAEPVIETLALGDESAFAWTSSSWTYASDALDDTPVIVAHGAHVSLSGRIRATFTPADETGYYPFNFPERFAPAGDYHHHLIGETSVINGGNVWGPLIRARIRRDDFNLPALELFALDGQTPVWGTGTWITFHADWIRTYPVPEGG